jgi:NADH-quinone oxidoreductase subunit M
MWAANGIAVFGVINIVYAAFVCLAQKDLKKLIAYSSVSHMGFSLLGIAAMTPTAISGAVLNLFTHGIVSPMLFLIVGVIYDRAHHREIERFGGLASELPEYTAIMGLAFFASLGLPGLCGFISEFMVFSGAFPIFMTYTIISATSVIITAAYYLWAIHRMFLGKLNVAYKGYPDLNWRERFSLYPLGAIAVVLGFYPQAILEWINPTLHGLIQGIRPL